MLALFEIIDSDKIPAKGTNKSDSNSQTTDSSYQGFNQPNQPSAAGSIRSLNSSPSHSTTSFPNSKDWFKKLHSRNSMAPSSIGSNASHVDLSGEMLQLITRCLQKCGEESGYMPLFKVIFTSLNDVNENRYTRLLDGRARDILLTGVISRMVHYVSKHVGLLFICDDVQCKFNYQKLTFKTLNLHEDLGADTASIRMLQYIHEHCQKILIVMATRPIKDYNVSFIEEYRATGSYQEIGLNGLGDVEIGEIILQNFDSGVHRISPEIVRVIQVSVEIIFRVHIFLHK